MILRAIRLRIPLQNWLDEQVLVELGLKRLALSNIVGLHRVPCVTRCDRGCLMFTGLY